MAEQSSVVYSTLTDEDEKSFETIFNKRGVTGLYEYSRRKLDSWLNVSLNIAVTGGSGKGKSSFINAILNLKVDDEGAAFTDVKETTLERKRYEHPANKNIVFWDLPGVGTKHFKQEDYLNKVKLNEYDFFILVSSERFSENDCWLAEEIRKMDKRFFFVRTKVDNDINAEKRSRKKNRRTPETILDLIRSDCKECLNNLGFPESHVFLVDNLSPYLFDFDRLSKQLIEDAPKRKRETLLFSIKGYACQVINEKKKHLEKRIPLISLGSAVVPISAAVPIPGLGLSVDFAVIISEITFYREQFGLTDDDIKDTAEFLGLREEELKEEFGIGTFLQKCTRKGIITLCLQAAYSANSAEISKYTIIPLLLGSIANGMISYRTTSYCLTTMLEDIYKVSVKISEKMSSDIVETPLD
ncbi:interferon-gamma-inducible GTPase 10-like [Ruditapes philippinarum]|uniref:interferon-gamma-inducible GTPase 10-like n=1 Tax=Ruditapes philippinarum TaxID=129788 RepID=UPI00295C093A|nr:interferon-gamma-inducible GTPase 10-like [Ruditapes philippinarum]